MNNSTDSTKERKTLTSMKIKTTTLFKTSWAMLFILTLFTWQCKKDTFKGETVGICPNVISTDPGNGNVNVLISKKITATFNKKMDSSTINNASFRVKQGSTPIVGNVTYSGNTATFTPVAYFDYNTIYTATITTNSKDLDGNALPENYIWSFTTGFTSNANQPVVISTDPYNAENNVAINRKISAAFNKEMDPATIIAPRTKFSNCCRCFAIQCII